MLHPRVVLTACFVIFFASSPAFGQSNFEPGYIITHNQDSIYGEIDNRGDTRNGRICAFRNGPSDESTEYSPEEIRAYRFSDGKYYISMDLNVDGEETRVFAEYLVNGISDLLYHRSINEDHYYIETKEGEWLELTNESLVFMKDGRTVTKESNRYLGMLKANFSDCPEIMAKVDQATFKHKSLIDLTSQYHDYVCTTGEECIIYEKIPPAVRLHISPGIGMALNGFSMYAHPEFMDRTFTSSRDLLAGLRFQVTLPRLNDKISFLMLPEYGESYFYSYLKTEINATGTHNSEIHFHRSFLSTALGLQYTFPKGKIRPTFAAGPVLAFNVETDLRERVEMVSLSQVRTYVSTENQPTNGALGAFAEAGLEWVTKKNNRVLLNLRYQYTIGQVEKIVIRSEGIPAISGIYGMSFQGFSLSAGYFLF